MMADPSSSSFRVEKVKAPSSTYNIDDNSNKVPSEKDHFGWLEIRPLDNGELL